MLPNLPASFFFCARDAMYSKMESVIQQLLARSARLIILCNEGDANMHQYRDKGGCQLIEVGRGGGLGLIKLHHGDTPSFATQHCLLQRPARGAAHQPSTHLLSCQVPGTVDCLQPVVNIIPLQLLSYHITVLRGLNVDQPRNLAKSVTVTD